MIEPTREQDARIDALADEYDTVGVAQGSGDDAVVLTCIRAGKVARVEIVETDGRVADSFDRLTTGDEPSSRTGGVIA